MLKTKNYFALQSNLHIQCSALLNDGMSYAGDFKSGSIFIKGFYHIKGTTCMRFNEHV